MVYRIVLASSLLLLASCTINTNLGEYLKSKADTEVRSSLVDVYGKDEIFRYQYTFLGQVEADFCQNERFGTLPPESKLKRVLRAKAQKKGANGIVYGLCETKKTYRSCDLYMSCDAAVYTVKH